MKRVFYFCLSALILCFFFIKTSAQSNVIGTPIKIGNIEVAQYDFPNRMKWIDANRTCLNLGQGWRLPTKDEIQILYNNKNQIGNLQDPYLAYWSSTEIDNNIAWYGVMKDGFTRNTEKFYESGVRAVRTVTNNSAFSQTNAELEKKQLNQTNNKPNDDLNSKITDFNRQIGSIEKVKSKYQVGAYINENDIVERIGLGGIYWGIKINGKWGITNTQRILQVPIIYDDIKPNYVGDIFRVIYNGKHGYINHKGNYIIPPLYDEISLFQSSLRYNDDNKQWLPSHLNSDIAEYRVGDKWGYIDINGKVITDAIFSVAYSFISNVAPVMKEDKYGLINRSGFPIIPIIFKDMESRYLISGFNAIAFTNEKNQVGVYNISGGLIMPFSNVKITMDVFDLGSTTPRDDIPPFIKVSGKIQLVKNIDRLIPDYGLFISEDTKSSPGFKNTFLGKYYYSFIGNDYSSSIDKSSNVNSDFNPSSSNLSNECKSNLQLLFNSSKRSFEIIKKAQGYYFDFDAYEEELKNIIALEKKIKSCPKFNSTETEVWNQILSYSKGRDKLQHDWELLWKQKKIVDINNQLSYGNQWQCGICGFESKLTKKPSDGAFGGCRSRSFHSWSEANSNRGYQCSICGFKSYISSSSGPKKPSDGAYGGCRSRSFHSWVYFGN
jgi:hypothetical protein